METLQLDDVCRVVSPATFRTGRALSSQWICEYPTGTLLKILEFDSSEVGRQRARVQTQLKYIFGWISIRTAGLVYLVEKVDADEATNFEIPEATKLCGLEVDLSFDRLEPESVRAASIHAIDRIKSDPDFISLSQQTLMERIQGLFWSASRGPESEDFGQLRCNVWASVSFRRDGIEGLAIVAVLLISQHAAVQDLGTTFNRLYEEILCLEDTDADTLFNVHGETHQALTAAKALAKKCQSTADGMLLPDSSWQRQWPDPRIVVQELERGSNKLKTFQEDASKISAQRRVFVARLKAVVEARAATEAVSATTLLADALTPGKRLDFPLVTEICERATSDASELAQVAETLEAMLQSQHLPTRLKVLTIANELLYDDSACQTLASKAAFLNVDLAEHDPEEEPNMALELAAANANILASEISRRLASVAVAVHGSCFSFKSAAASTSSLGGSATSWLASVARTPERQDAQLEPLSWARTRSAIRALELRVRSSTASAEDAIGVLDQTYRSFEHTTGSILRLQGASEAADADFHELTESFLSSAALVQSSALDWKCQVVDAADIVAPHQPAASCYISQLKISSKALGKFLGRATSVGDSLNACLAVLLARRSESP